jgi:hypothetical protein
MNKDIERILDLQLKLITDRDSVTDREVDELMRMVPAYCQYLFTQKTIVFAGMHYYADELTPRQLAYALREAADEIEFNSRYPDKCISQVLEKENQDGTDQDDSSGG